MKTKLNLMLLLFFSLIFGELESQIDSMKVIPANPTATDTIRVICYSTHPGGGCPRDSFKITPILWNCCDWGITSYHTSNPMLPFICFSVDTVTLFPFSAGSHCVKYFIMVNNSVNDSSNMICFYVSPGSGIIETVQNKLNIFPNPMSSYTAIELRDQSALFNANLEITDVMGRRVRYITDINSPSLYIERDILKSGLYFLRLRQDNKVIATEKLLVE
jgi:hypothetical protein